MYYKRLIDSHLREWKHEANRKPLLLRGARQVGKSSAVRNLALEFDNFLEINFEEQPQLRPIFDKSLTPEYLVERLSVATNHIITPGKTLLFFDEIQSCPQAISSLRFFYEKMPELHLVAAGSLLEFALQSLPSFGVGRVRSFFMFPFSFDEFLWATGSDLLYKAKMEASMHQPLDHLLHEQLTEQLMTFMLTGGMPEAVTKYVKERSLLKTSRILDDLLITLRADFSKYHARVPAFRLNETLSAVANQSGSKFVYARVSEQIKDAQAKEALELLILAGWVIPITHSSASGLPIGAGADARRRKMILLDTGLFQRISGLDFSQIFLDKTLALSNRGALAEQFWALEFMKYQAPGVYPELYYWHRESAKANAEVDYLVQQHGEIFPVEIKANTKGAMQSLRLFLAEKNLSHGYRFSLEKHGQLPDIHIWPLYAISSFVSQANKPTT